jgi:hypothetical protein
MSMDIEQQLQVERATAVPVTAGTPQKAAQNRIDTESGE